MVTKEHETKKYCCFYASDFHLEMILLPYIKRNLDKPFYIITQKDLSDSLKLLLDRTNLQDDEKNKILNLEWSNNKIEKIYNSKFDEMNIIINGDFEFIKKINEKIKKLEIKNINIIDCYNIDQVKDKAIELQKNYNCVLNIKKGYYSRLLI